MVTFLSKIGNKVGQTSIKMWEQIKQSWSSGSMLNRIIWINIIVFALIEISSLFNLGDENLWLATSADLQVLKYRPWTIVTHMFVHDGVWHLFWNLIGIWGFGRMYQAEEGSRKLLSTYVMGGLAGIIFVIGSVHLLPALSDFNFNISVMGASSAMFAIIAATATLNPNKKVNFILFGTVQLQHIAFAILLLNYFLFRDKQMEVMMGHFGGVLMGFLIVSQAKKGRNISLWLEWIFDVFMSIIPTKGGTKTKFKVFKGKKKPKAQSTRPKSDDEFNSERREKELKVDAILDKISRHGYDHLTKEEKEFLFKQSKK